jgi:two-component system sensor histidine kinase KdpD
MRKIRFDLLPEMLSQALKGLLAVTLTTVILLFIGRRILGEGVIALLYLIPVGWSASRWGQAAGMAAALSAALMFDFLFIPPFLTFTIASVEGVMILVIFFTVAILVVGRIQSALSRAQTSEREAIFMYELSSALAGLRTQDAVARTLARQLQQMYQARMVKVALEAGPGAHPIVVQEPRTNGEPGKPDLIVPILNSWGLVGEIHLWEGLMELPREDSRLLQNFSGQAGQALERTRLLEAEAQSRTAVPVESL